MPRFALVVFQVVLIGFLVQAEDPELTMNETEWVQHKSDKSAASFSATKDVKFFLYTRQNRNNFQQIKMDNSSIRKSNFSSNRKTRFLIHGFENDVNSQFNVLMKNTLLDAADLNVIVVDWGKGAKTLDYFSARCVNSR